MGFKSIKLSNTKRQEIVESILNKWDTNNPKKCNKKLSNVIAEYYYNKAFKNILPLLSDPKLKNFFTYKNYVKVQENNNIVVYDLLEKKPYPVANCHYTLPVIYVSDTSHKLNDKIENNNIFNSNLKDERNKFERELFQTINSVNTTGQLKEIWPEVVDYLPKYMVDPSTSINLPTIAIASLNAKLEK